jgi:hypothetical protein
MYSSAVKRPTFRSSAARTLSRRLASSVVIKRGRSGGNDLDLVMLSVDQRSFSDGMGDGMRSVKFGEMEFVFGPVGLGFHKGGVRLVLMHPGIPDTED